MIVLRSKWFGDTSHHFCNNKSWTLTGLEASVNSLVACVSRKRSRKHFGPEKLYYRHNVHCQKFYFEQFWKLNVENFTLGWRNTLGLFIRRTTTNQLGRRPLGESTKRYCWCSKGEIGAAIFCFHPWPHLLSLNFLHQPNSRQCADLHMFGCIERI